LQQWTLSLKVVQKKYGTSVSRPTDWQKFLSDLFESIWQVMSVTGEFISIAVIYVGTVVFFAWVFVTIFDDMEEMVHGTPVNLGLDSFSRPEGPHFGRRLIVGTASQAN